ncbi:hypothetical protein [Flavobacterium sp.]|uniref:hypothetical protein n=1 Tax=Flavobacterium sp. TaxID=239 RepID=UPI003D6B1CAA
MKNLFFSLCSSLFLLSGCSVQKDSTEINQKLDSKSEKEIVLVKVIEDSRCPEGVQCIWAGEVTIVVAAYENKKKIEQVQFVINQNSMDDVNKWFTQHLPQTNKSLKETSVLPYPKEGVQIKPEDYHILLIY